MPKFQYSAKDAAGALVKETLDIDSEGGLVAAIRERGLYLIDYKRLDKEGTFSKDLFSGGKLGTKQLAVFCRQISAMLVSGVSLVKSIDILYQQSYDKKMKNMLQKLYESVQKGELLSEGLSKQTGVFPEIMISMIESGEASGTLDVVMQKLAAQFEADLKLRNKLISSVTYPAILVALCVGIVALLMVVVLPTFMDMFAGLEEDAVPMVTRILIGISEALSTYWYIALFIIIAVPAVLNAYFKTESGRLFWHGAKLQLPLFGPITSRVVAVRFCRTFSTLFSSGMAMLPALEIVGRVVSNQVVSDALAGVRDDIRKGVSLSQAVSQVSAFPPMIYSMISIGEESGTLDSVLESTARYFDDEVENAVQRMVTFIEPILLIFMGAVVGFVVLSIMLPMMSLMQSIE